VRKRLKGRERKKGRLGKTSIILIVLRVISLRLLVGVEDVPTLHIGWGSTWWEKVTEH